MAAVETTSAVSTPGGASLGGVEGRVAEARRARLDGCDNQSLELPEAESAG